MSCKDVTEKDKLEIIEKYKSGESLYKLSRRFGCSGTFIRNILVDAGVHVRSLIEAAHARESQEDTGSYMPCPQEIQRRADALRTLSLRQSRQMAGPNGTVPPSIPTCKIFRGPKKPIR